MGACAIVRDEQTQAHEISPKRLLYRLNVIIYQAPNYTESRVSKSSPNFKKIMGFSKSLDEF